MKRYDDCQYDAGGDCAACPLSSFNRDCRNNPVNTLARYRSLAAITQAKLADLSDVNIRQIQKLEKGDTALANITLKNAVALARALGIAAEDLLS